MTTESGRGGGHALEYMDLERRTPITRHHLDRSLHRFLHERAHRGSAAAAAWSRAASVARNVQQALVVPGSGLVKAQAEARAWPRSSSMPVSSGVQRAARCAWHEPGPLSPASTVRPPRTATSRAARGTAAYPPGQPGHGRSGRGRGSLCRCEGVALMQAFHQHTGAVPLDRVNVDTDQIIPKQYLKSIQRTGFGDYLFDAWRFDDEGDIGVTPNERQINPRVRAEPDAAIRAPAYLLARDNFGCGSIARARGVGATGIRIPSGHRAVVCRHLSTVIALKMACYLLF